MDSQQIFTKKFNIKVEHKHDNEVLGYYYPEFEIAILKNDNMYELITFYENNSPCNYGGNATDWEFKKDELLKLLKDMIEVLEND